MLLLIRYIFRMSPNNWKTAQSNSADNCTRTLMLRAMIRWLKSTNKSWFQSLEMSSMSKKSKTSLRTLKITSGMNFKVNKSLRNLARKRRSRHSWLSRWLNGMRWLHSWPWLEGKGNSTNETTCKWARSWGLIAHPVQTQKAWRWIRLPKSWVPKKREESGWTNLEIEERTRNWEDCECCDKWPSLYQNFHLKTRSNEFDHEGGRQKKGIRGQDE